MIAQYKKGQKSQIMILILVLASAVALLLFVGGWLQKSGGEESSISACRLSVMTQATAKFGLIDKDSPFDINCDKRYVTFYNTRVERGLSPDDMKPVPVNYGTTRLRKFSSLNEFVVDQVIAEELRTCKHQFGDGKIKIFPNDDRGFFDKNICFVCSEINFESTVKPNIFTELKEFSRQTKYSEEGITYYDYLTEPTVYNEPMWEQAVLSEESDYTNAHIDTSKKYFVYVQKYSFGAGREFKWLALGNPLAATIIPLIRTQDAITVGIISDEYINEVCDIQAS